jgi:hypothetical protein
VRKSDVSDLRQLTMAELGNTRVRKSDVSDLRQLTMAELGNTRVRKSDVSDLRQLTMAELGNTRVLRKCGIFLCINHPDCASLHTGYACFTQPILQIRRWNIGAAVISFAL